MISKYINAKAALDEIGEDDSSKFLKDVIEFCDYCLDGKYYFDPEDYDYYDKYGYDYDYETAYKSFDAIVNCLHQAENEISIFGTDVPREYIKTNWEEVFDEYYSALKNYIKDEEAIKKFADKWINFGEACTEPILKHTDNMDIEKRDIDRVNNYVYSLSFDK